MNDMHRPQALLVFESMFGCTESVARSVAEGLEAGGYDVRVRDVREADPPDGRTVHLLVVGAPTHAFSLSRPGSRREAVQHGAAPERAALGLREWLARMGRQDGQGRPAAAFDTRVTKVRHLPKSASTRASHLLAHGGWRIAARPTPFFVEDLKGPVLPGELERARAWGHDLALRARDQHAATG